MDWWPSTQTISVQGNMSGKTDIEDKIGELLKNNAATEPHTIIYHELPKILVKMHHRRNKLQQVKIVLRNYGKQLTK